MEPFGPNLRRVYWETTAGCNLKCIHCRRSDVLSHGSPEELSTNQGKQLIDALAVMGKPVLIFSGGEPLFRRDIFDLTAYAKSAGLPVALNADGMLKEKLVSRVNGGRTLRRLVAPRSSWRRSCARLRGCSSG